MEGGGGGGGEGRREVKKVIGGISGGRTAEGEAVNDLECVAGAAVL